MLDRPEFLILNYPGNNAMILDAAVRPLTTIVGAFEYAGPDGLPVFWISILIFRSYWQLSLTSIQGPGG